MAQAADTSAQPDVESSAETRWAEIEELGLTFRRLFRALGRIRGRDTHLAAGELSHAQFELLLELYERGELSAGELAGAARLSPATVTQMLEALTDSGHVERTRSDSDRRVVTARLTPLGAQRIEAKREAWRARWQTALEGFDEHDLRAATRVLGRLGEMFEAELCKAPGQAPPTGRKPA